MRYYTNEKQLFVNRYGGEKIRMGIDNQQWIHNSLEHLVNPYICLIHMGWEKCKPGYSYTNYRDIYLIHFVKSGKGTLTINNTEHTFSANQAFLIRPEQLATYTADFLNPWEYCYFAFSGAFSSELIENTVFRNGNIKYDMPDTRLASEIYTACEKIYSSESVEWFGLECLFKFLQLLHAVPSQNNEKVNHNYLKYVAPVEQYIQFHYRDRDSIMEFVKKIGIERSYFYRIFKMHTGKSLEKYLISFRIQQAKIMLCDSDMPIDEIANIVGYDNYVAFYKSFKKLVGKAPSDYRTQLHKEKMLENENNLFQEMR